MRTPSSRAACSSASTSPLDAAREDVVVVEDGRAARERELGEPGARGGVLHLGVDPRPDRVERAQPGEEVGLLRPGARERLVEVVVRVDEAGRDDGAAEVVRPASGGSPAPTSATSPSSTRSQPRSCSVPASSIVTIQAFARIMRPPAGPARSGRRRRARGRSASGSGSPTAPGTRGAGTAPRPCTRARAAAATTRAAPRDDLLERRVRQQAGDRQRQLRQHLRRRRSTTIPPPMFASRRTANAIAASLIPTTTTLCASCATVEASAPRRSPKPRTNPSPIRPVPRWRSITAIFARSRSASATASPARTVGSSTSDSVTICPGTSPITRARPPRHGMRNISGPSAPTRTVCRTQSGTSARGISATGRPALSTRSGTNRSRSGSTSRSAW